VAGARVLALLESRLRKLTGLERLRAARYTALARELANTAEEDGGPALLTMLLDDFHREALQENRFPDNRPMREDAAASRGHRKRRSRRRRGGETKENI
jgi:ATP-dependent RNA helicase DeaD